MRKYEPDTAVIVMASSVFSHMRANRQCSVLEAMREAAQVLLNAAHTHYEEERAAQRHREVVTGMDIPRPAPRPTQRDGLRRESDVLLAQLDAQPRMFKDAEEDLRLFREAASRIRELERTPQPPSNGDLRLHLPVRYNSTAQRYELAAGADDALMVEVPALGVL